MITWLLVSSRQCLTARPCATLWVVVTSWTVSHLYGWSNDCILTFRISTAYHDVNGKVCHCSSCPYSISWCLFSIRMAALFSLVPFSLNVTELKMPITEVVRVNLMAALISSLTVMVIAKISSWLGNSQTVGFILRRYWKRYFCNSNLSISFASRKCLQWVLLYWKYRRPS